MSKIVQAVNAMVSHPEQIRSVQYGASSEIFFRYKDKYKWSARRDADGEINLWYYPGPQDFAQLCTFSDDDWEDVPMVWYSDQEIGTKEAKATFRELYTMLREKLYRIDEALDDIISDSDMPF